MVFDCPFKIWYNIYIKWHIAKFGGKIMKKAIYMSIHYPCVLLLAMQEYWWMHRDSITSLTCRLVCEAKGFIKKLIPQALKFIIYLPVVTPVVAAFMILFIKLS